VRGNEQIGASSEISVRTDPFVLHASRRLSTAKGPKPPRNETHKDSNSAQARANAQLVTRGLPAPHWGLQKVQSLYFSVSCSPFPSHSHTYVFVRRKQSIQARTSLGLKGCHLRCLLLRQQIGR
jgi:hypothetical protein